MKNLFVLYFVMSCVAICDSAVSSEKQPLFSDMAGFSVNSGS